MEIITNHAKAYGIKFSIVESDQEVARAYLYLIYNDLHSEPFGLLEDVHVLEKDRGRGLGTQLVNEVIRKAQEKGCYKLIATSRKSRPKVHALYERLGFVDHGLEFRIDF